MFTCRPIKRGEQVFILMFINFLFILSKYYSLNTQNLIAIFQLFDCYGPVVRTNRRTRQDYLQNYYHFICDCEPCKRKWPTDLKCVSLLVGIFLFVI